MISQVLPPHVALYSDAQASFEAWVTSRELGEAWNFSRGSCQDIINSQFQSISAISHLNLAEPLDIFGPITHTKPSRSPDSTIFSPILRGNWSVENWSIKMRPATLGRKLGCSAAMLIPVWGKNLQFCSMTRFLCSIFSCRFGNLICHPKPVECTMNIYQGGEKAVTN